MSSASVRSEIKFEARALVLPLGFNHLGLSVLLWNSTVWDQKLGVQINLYCPHTETPYISNIPLRHSLYMWSIIQKLPVQRCDRKSLWGSTGITSLWMYYSLIELLPNTSEIKVILSLLILQLCPFPYQKKALKERKEPLILYPTLHLQSRLSFLPYI